MLSQLHAELQHAYTKREKKKTSVASLYVRFVHAFVPGLHASQDPIRLSLATGHHQPASALYFLQQLLFSIRCCHSRCCIVSQYNCTVFRHAVRPTQAMGVQQQRDSAWSTPCCVPHGVHSLAATIMSGACSAHQVVPLQHRQLPELMG